jgi:hypothetical protein
MMSRLPFSVMRRISSPSPGPSSWCRPGLGAGHAHKVNNLEDWNGSSLGVEIKLHGGYFAQSSGD